MAKYHDLTLGQVEAVINKIGGIDGVRGLLAGELKVIPVGKETAKPARQGQILIRDGSFSAVELTERSNPKDFYQDREGLWIDSDFVSWIVAAANPVEAGTIFKKTAFWKLVQNATGQKLLSKYPKNVWTATDFCAWLPTKLAGQPNGKVGELLNTGWANLFLVEGINGEVFVVAVVWGSDPRKWRVDAWDLGHEWGAGRRFVSKPIAL